VTAEPPHRANPTESAESADPVALVTGGASGLGAATARYLHGGGTRVVLFDRDGARGEAIAHELGTGATFIEGSVLSSDDIAQAIEAGQALGRLGLLVNCAGGGTASARTVSRNKTPHDLDLFTETVALNLTGSFNVLRLVAAAMADNDLRDGERGAVVLTASIAGYEGQIGQIAYGSAKAGVIGMTLIAARDLAAIGVRVNCIAPGTMGTRAWERAPAGMREGLEAQVPFPSRLGAPEEFAALVEHLATNHYLNGEVIRLDGAIRFTPK
jgi:NAD(P)-dependent dehydrogenase (short-subunit alcohol dehydrogenase family)